MELPVSEYHLLRSNVRGGFLLHGNSSITLALWKELQYTNWLLAWHKQQLKEYWRSTRTLKYTSQNNAVSSHVSEVRIIR